MTREHKLALILGFAVVLAVGVLISDHLSSASASKIEALGTDTVPGAGGDAVASLPVIGATTESVPPSFADQLAARFREMERPPALQADMAEPTMDDAVIGGPLVDAGGAETDIWDAAFERSVTTMTMGSQSYDAATMLEDRANAALTTKASNPAPVSRHVVQEGESLWGIAEQHYGDGRLYVKLAKFNAGKVGADGELNEGATLLIPAKADLTRDPNEVAKAAPASKQAPTTDAKGARTYTIREGDTLSEIAQRMLGSGRRWSEIYAMNKSVISDPDVAPVGVTIRLPAR